MARLFVALIAALLVAVALGSVSKPRNGRGQFIDRDSRERNVARPAIANERTAVGHADDCERRLFGMRAALGAARNMNIKARAKLRRGDLRDRRRQRARG